MGSNPRFDILKAEMETGLSRALREDRSAKHLTICLT